MSVARKRFVWLSLLFCCAAMAAALVPASQARAEGPNCSCGIECWIELPGFRGDTDSMTVPCITVRPGDPVYFKVAARRTATPDTCECWEQCRSAYLWLGNIARPPFLRPVGHKTGRGYAKLEVRQVAGSAQPGCYWMKFLAKNSTGSKWNECNVKICLLPPLCDEPSTCTVDQTSIAATVGTSSDFIVCAQSGCEGEHAKAKLLNPPGFVWLVGEFTDAEGNCCYHYRIDACTTDAGTHTLEFESYNYGDDKPSGSCSVEVTIN